MYPLLAEGAFRTLESTAVSKALGVRSNIIRFSSALKLTLRITYTYLRIYIKRVVEVDTLKALSLCSA